MSKLSDSQRADVEEQLRADGLRLARDWYDPKPERGWYQVVRIDNGYGARIVIKVWATDAPRSA